jgi:membrane protease YdiL (CAAX protease family)
LLDTILTALLVVGVPGYMLWNSLAKRGAPPDLRLRRYIRSIILALGLDGLLIVDWLTNGRGAAALGLGVPVDLPGMIGIGLAIGVLVVLTLVSRRQLRSGKTPDQEALALFPTTRTELVLFIALSLVVGCSWEILFRGYLLWVLRPHIGLVAGVFVAAGAYGIAHGFKTVRTFAASLVSALIFTVAYSATGSLWWLMIVHSGLPLLALLAVTAQRRRGNGEALPIEAAPS